MNLTLSIILISGVLSPAIWRAQASVELNDSLPRQNKDKGGEKVYTSDEVDVKARIKNRLEHLPERKNDCPDPVEAKVRVILHKSGKVKDVVLTASAGCSYDDEVIKVVKKLKFVPARKDGQPVSQYSEVVYETHSTSSPSDRQ